MSDMQFVARTPSKRIRFSAEPLYNALCSMCLLSQEQLDSISGWVDATKQHLTDDERKMAGLACHIVPYVKGTGASTVDQFLAELGNARPEVFLRTTAERMLMKGRTYLPDQTLPAAADIAANEQIFVELVRRVCEARDLCDKFDAEEEAEEYRKLSDGAGYRDEAIAAVKHLWDTYLRDEWPRVAPTIESAVEAFQSIDVPGDSIAEQLRFITERDELPEEWLTTLDGAREVVFIPSVHIGPFMILLEFDGTTVYVAGRARTPEGSTVRTVELDHSDVLVRLEALSDGTRLRILEMAADQETITTADVMERLDLSQSSASRHLNQLTATGLLAVDASERTKRYRVNESRLDQVFSGLKNLLGSRVPS